MNRFSYFKIYLLSFEGLLNYFYYVQFVKVKIIEFGYFRGHEDLREMHHILGMEFMVQGCCGLSR